MDDEWSVVRELADGALFGHAEVAKNSRFHDDDDDESEFCFIFKKRRCCILRFRQTKLDFASQQRFHKQYFQILFSRIDFAVFFFFSFCQKVSAEIWDVQRAGVLSLLQVTRIYI